MTKAFCVYNNSYYTAGSIVCQNGVAMVCTIPANNDPYWKDSGRRCDESHIFDSDEALVTVSNNALRSANNITVDYNDGYKLRYRSPNPCQFTVKYLNNGHTRVFRMDNTRVVLLGQLPRSKPDYKQVWDVVAVAPVDPHWGVDVLNSVDQYIVHDTMLWVRGNGQRYTTITYEDVQPNRKEVKTKIVPPGAERCLGIRTNGYDCRILSARLDDDFITQADASF